ncbi:glutamine amidotransferase-related protein [Paenibacillus polymyxa]|uniref:glutamine amidotransferase-related protein n=1 Tax=Paenibacillus polymyxa TaxID=1406 RepID=UPI003D2E9595
MKIVVFRHFSFDDPSVIASWSKHAGHELIVQDPAQGIDKKWLKTLDLLVILGGPMSVCQEKEHPWLIEEKAFVKIAIEMKKKVLGICLGAQMISEVLGDPYFQTTKRKLAGMASTGRKNTMHG